MNSLFQRLVEAGIISKQQQELASAASGSTAVSTSGAQETGMPSAPEPSTPAVMEDPPKPPPKLQPKEDPKRESFLNFVYFISFGS